MLALVWLIPVLPLLGFLINGLLGNKMPKAVVGAIGSFTVLLSFIIVLSLFLAKDDAGNTLNITIDYFNFINVGSFLIPFSFLIDPLSILMMLIITGVGFFIHLYSIGYMHDDDGFARYFAYLNLFVFFMLLLVMGSNYIILFVGWEGVGLCSYLLIGFWFNNNNYNDAAKKAFIMNRIGDLGFLLGVFLIYWHFDTITFEGVFSSFAASPVEAGALTAITLLLFVGATGKSAQIPLFTWLPDAMAGPTPVSALIHAATMVTAGIYMIARSGVLYAAAETTSMVITIVALFTIIYAAIVALTQNDIKKVLAYSTVSQLGYMFLALGLGSYTAALFHVMTHAFFKACLFLGSGSVIHAMGGEQDMRKMGGLKKYMPITHITFLISSLAIAGVPGLAGFFSKDAILALAFQHSPLIWAVAMSGALMTAFYMFRLYFLTFHGSFRGTHDQEHHLHESPLVMTLPLMVLAGLSVIGGYLNIPEVFAHGLNSFDKFLMPVVTSVSHGAHLSHATEYGLMGFSLVAVVGMITWAYTKYTKPAGVPGSDETFAGVHKAAYNKFYVDELYDWSVRKPVDFLSGIGYSFMEQKVIDGIAVNGTGKTALFISGVVRKLQTGSIGTYVYGLVAGLVLILVYFSLLA